MKKPITNLAALWHALEYSLRQGATDAAVTRLDLAPNPLLAACRRAGRKKQEEQLDKLAESLIDSETDAELDRRMQRLLRALLRLADELPVACHGGPPPPPPAWKELLAAVQRELAALNAVSGLGRTDNLARAVQQLEQALS